MTSIKTISIALALTASAAIMTVHDGRAAVIQGLSSLAQTAADGAPIELVRGAERRGGDRAGGGRADRGTRDRGSRDGAGRDRGAREGGREGGLREGGVREGGFRDGAVRGGAFRDGAFRGGVVRDGSVRTAPVAGGTVGRGEGMIGAPGPGVRPWVNRSYYGTVVGGVAVGAVTTAAVAGTAPQPVGNGLCWYWADQGMSQGYWDYC
jgi:hypothetical protein